MKRLLFVFLGVLLLSGCGAKKNDVEPGLLLREKILSANGCSFDASVVADYGEKCYTFNMRCTSDISGNVVFTVTGPESISDITGTVSAEGGALTFDDQVLAFEMLADGQITPVSAPWLFIRSLRSGYIRLCEEKNDMIHLVIDDSYAEKALQVDVYMHKDRTPVRADILWEGKRIVALTVENFKTL